MEIIKIIKKLYLLNIWNVRGMKDQSKENEFRDQFKKCCLVVKGLSETKLKGNGTMEKQG